MTNREKYKEKLLDISIEGAVMAIVGGVPMRCHEVYCPDCDMFEFCETDEVAEAAYRQEWAEEEAE